MPHCGIYNLGNSCYINSALQYLVHIPEFNATIFDHKDKNDIAKAYVDLYDAYTTNKYVPKPSEIVQLEQFFKICELLVFFSNSISAYQ